MNTSHLPRFLRRLVNARRIEASRNSSLIEAIHRGEFDVIECGGCAPPVLVERSAAALKGHQTRRQG